MAQIIETAGGLAVVKTSDRDTFHVVRLFGNDEVQSISSSAFADFCDAGIRYVSSVNGTYETRAKAMAALRKLAAKQGYGQ